MGIYQTHSTRAVPQAAVKGAIAYQLGRGMTGLSEREQQLYEACSTSHSETGDMPLVKLPHLGEVRYIDSKPRTSSRRASKQTKHATTTYAAQALDQQRFSMRMKALAKRNKRNGIEIKVGINFDRANNFGLVAQEVVA